MPGDMVAEIEGKVNFQPGGIKAVSAADAQVRKKDKRFYNKRHIQFSGRMV